MTTTDEEYHSDKELLRKILRGEIGHSAENYAERGEWLTYQQNANDKNWYVYTSGGFYLIYRFAGTTPILNLDLGDASNDVRIRQLRGVVTEIFGEMNKPLITCSGRALDRGVSGYRGTAVLVHRDGMESVFTAVDSDRKMHWFLSGYDAQETPPLYFLTELPKAVPTVAAARQALKPPSVLAAEAEGLVVVRQGDMFAIPTKMHKTDILALGADITEYSDGGDAYSIRSAIGRNLYGTAHTATKVATLPDGVHFAKGQLLHRPILIREARRPDHSDRDLPGRFWYVITKNTTPIASARR